jgi:release factor glutamine methyltransferase
MAGDDSMTVLDVIKFATGYLEKNGVEDARLNAEHLLAHALGKKKRLDLYLEFDRPLSETDRAPLRDLVRQRGLGTPLQHLLGTAEFHGREFKSDARALIPRPETEQLVELALSTLNGQLSTNILDVGTGSGVIAITLALARPDASVTALDASPDALALARENAAALGATVTFVEGDLLPSEPVTFDLIVANLPYIPSGEIAALSREVQRDPLAALDGGQDGLDLVRRLIEQGAQRLAPGGSMFLEIGHDQAARVAELFATHGYRDVATHRDYPGVERFVSAIR